MRIISVCLYFIVVHECKDFVYGCVIDLVVDTQVGVRYGVPPETAHEVNLPPADFVKFALFALGDVNNDSKLTFDEFLHTNKLLLKDQLRAFAQVDKNNDSFASKEEYIVWFQKGEADYKNKVEEYEKTLVPSVTIPYQFDTPGVRFSRGDANKDEKLTFQEFFYTDKFILDLFRNQFKKVDTNVDDFVTQEELDTYIGKLD